MMVSLATCLSNGRVTQYSARNKMTDPLRCRKLSNPIRLRIVKVAIKPRPRWNKSRKINFEND